MVEEQSVPMEIDVISVQDSQLINPILTVRNQNVPSTDEAFAAKFLADLGQEEEDFQVFTWRVKGYRTQGKRLVSPEFECGGHKW